MFGHKSPRQREIFRFQKIPFQELQRTACFDYKVVFLYLWYHKKKSRLRKFEWLAGGENAWLSTAPFKIETQCGCFYVWASLLRFSACLWCARAETRRGERHRNSTKSHFLTQPDILFFYLIDRESCAQTETHTYTYIHILIYKQFKMQKNSPEKGHFLSRKKKGRWSSPLLCLCVILT